MKAVITVSLMLGAASFVSAQPCENWACDSAVMMEIADMNDIGNFMIVSTISGRINKLYHNGSLSGKKMTVLPASIGRLSELEALDLSNNDISEIPASISLCSNLNILKMDFNNLASLPEGLMSVPIDTPSTYTSYGSNKITYYLDLRYNRLCSIAGTMKAWINERSDPLWQTTQNCSTSVIFSPVSPHMSGRGAPVIWQSGKDGNTEVRFNVSNSGRVSLKVYSAGGRLAGTIADEYMNAGAYSMQWRMPGKIPAGVYYVTLKCGNLPAQTSCAVIY
jgi:hypothetical protein